MQLANCTLDKLPYFIQGEAAHTFANRVKDWEVK